MRRTLLLLSALLFAIGAPANLAMAVDYFVTDSDGTTGGDGSAGTPFGTINEAIANAPLGVGDRIVLGAGTWDFTNDGEAFPIVIPDGVSIVGAGSGLTTVNGEANTPFRNNGNTNTTILSDMTIVSTGSGIVVRAQDSPDDFRISSCVISGGAVGIYHEDAVDSSFGMTIRNNSFTNQGSAGIYINLNGTTATTGAQNLLIVGNTLTMGTSAVGISVAMRGYGHSATASIVSNTVSGGSEAIAGFWRCDTGGTYSADVVINQNSCFGQSGQGIVAEFLVRALGNGNIGLDLSGNDVTSCTGTGAAVSVTGLARSTATLGIGSNNCGIMSNVVSGNSGHGVMLVANATSGGSHTMDLDIQFNCIVNNGLVGLYQVASAASNGQAFMSGSVFRNIIMSNGWSGVRIGTGTVNTAFAGVTGLFFGNSGTAPGYNTIQDNATSTGFDFKLSVSDTGLSISAMCNWWGVGSTTVETLICDIADNAALGNVIGAPVAPNSLTGFTADVTEWENEGDPVVITAALGTTFISNIAGKSIVVTMGGLPVTNLIVLGDTLSFLVPVGITLADALILITNPGGQTGSLLLPYDAGIIVLPPGFFDDDGGGLCFVATAAFGDDDAPEVMVLRKWRDEHLNKHALGRAFVRTYYALSPSLAETISDNDSARSVTRAALSPLVGAVRLWMEAPWLMMLGGGVLAFSLLRRKR